MKLSEKQQQFSRMISDLIAWIYILPGYAVTFGEAWRSNETQEMYFKKDLSKVKSGQHQKRLAIDFNLFIHGKYVQDREKYRIVGEKWEELGGRWGGRFGIKKKDYAKKTGWDPGHFELP